MTVAVGSVVYVEALPFFNDFFRSLLGQKNQSFEVVLLNDNIPEERLRELLNRLPRSFAERIRLADYCGEGLSPVELRVELLLHAKKRGTDWLIMLDCDDMASDERVGNVMDSADSRISFLYNELVDLQGKHVFTTMPEETNSFRDIGQYNYLGLSNTAVNLNRLEIPFLESLRECRYPIFDWYLFSRMLIAGHRGRRVEGCTIYRIHEKNIAGKTVRSEDAVRKELMVKKNIYGLLAGYEDYYRKILEAIDKFRYVDNEDDSGYWWSLTRTEED